MPEIHYFGPRAIFGCSRASRGPRGCPSASGLAGGAFHVPRGIPPPARHAPRVPAINPAPPLAPGIPGAHPGLKYTHFWLGFFAFRIYSSKCMYCILYPSLPRFGSACMGCLLAAAPGAHPGLRVLAGPFGRRSRILGFLMSADLIPILL